MAGAESMVAVPAPSLCESVAVPARPVAEPLAVLTRPTVLSTGLATTGLAPVVMDQLALVLSAASPGGLSGVSGDQALAVVEAAEAVKAWADSVSLDATGVMVTELETDFADLVPENLSSRAWRLFFRWCRSAAAREIQVATGLPITQCQRRVWLTACEPERVGPIREAMSLGRVTLARAMTLAEATKDLDALTAAAIASRVLGPPTSPEGEPLPGMAPLSEATFRARLHRQLVLHHGLVGDAERTYTQAIKARRMSTEPQRDGSALILISGDGPRVAAAKGRVDTIARRLRTRGDARTLDQLRADVATDLLLRGWIPTDPTFTQLGEPPVALVQLIISLSTLLGVDAGVGHLSGWGDVPAQQARALALQAGSIWKRVVTDPLTGRAIEVSATSYKVPTAMAEQINARDRTCRAPGCQIPAEHCDHDHTNEWKPDDAGGPTGETNLADLHRGHHNLKTSGFWNSDQSPDGTLTWTTSSGRTFITYPFIYDHPDNLPFHTSSLEARLGRRLTTVTNPEISIPGYFSIFEEIAWAEALAPATPPPASYTFASTHHETPETNVKAGLTGEPPF